VIVESSAPTRVDLAGGTIDIPPLYLFHEGATTVNFAIDLMARCRIESRDDRKVMLESVDRGEKFEISLDQIDSLRNDPRLEMLSKLVYFFKPQTGFNMITESEAPAGAGLAGSSTLNIACIGALNKFVGDRYPSEMIIPIAANVECQVIKVPAGYQDYYSAYYGGVSCIHFKTDGTVREALDVDTSVLENRVAVCYTGEPRNSGTNNWEIMKRHIDGDKEIVAIFDGIRDTSIALRQAMLDGRWDDAGQILRDSHPERKRLSPNITTPQMDHLIETAMQKGAIAAKVCGAGGGGCIAFFCEEGKKAAVEDALAAEDGAEVLNWKLRREGLTVKTS
jgi:D-glycero-alpha-D-manno-heptose-7-phosphate kinase